MLYVMDFLVSLDRPTSGLFSAASILEHLGSQRALFALPFFCGILWFIPASVVATRALNAARVSRRALACPWC